MEDKDYFGSLTREQFLFHEMRIIAQLMKDGLSDEDIVKKNVEENLFQYPTERTLSNMTKVCLRRLHKLDNPVLLEAFCNLPVASAKQIGLYIMMKNYRPFADFMTSVVGEKFRTNDLNLTKADVNVFFLHLQEQDENVATWSDKTIAKLKQVIVKILIETDYLENARATELKPILINSTLENVIRANGENSYLIAFNCFN